MKKKLFALALALILCLGVLPMDALAGSADSADHVCSDHDHVTLRGTIGTWHGGDSSHEHSPSYDKLECLDDTYHQLYVYCSCNAKATLGSKEKHNKKSSEITPGGPVYPEGGTLWYCADGCGWEKVDAASSCSHKHKTKKWDDNNHWDECDDCHAQLNVKPHKKGSVKKDADKHWYACTGCDAHLEEGAHVAQYWKHNTNEHWQTCWCGTEIQGTRAPHDTHWDWDESKHWEVCGCGYETKHVKHTFVDGPEDNGKITSTCVCGATKERTLADLSAASFTGTKGDGAEYTSSEIKGVGLSGLKEGKEYTTTIATVKDSEGNEKWVKTFKSIEGVSTGGKTFTAKKKKGSDNGGSSATSAPTDAPPPQATEEPAVEATPDNTTPSDPPAAPPSDPTDPPATPETNVVAEGTPAATTEPTAAATLKPTPRFTIITNDSSCGSAVDTEEVDTGSGCGEKESMGKNSGVRNITAAFFGFIAEIFHW